MSPEKHLADELILERFEILGRIAGVANERLIASKARDVVDGRIVSLYEFPSELGREYLTEAARAILLASPLVHKNILTVSQTYTEIDRLFVVTEYVNGITLSERIRRVAPFTLAVAVEIALGASQGLRAGDAQGFQHGCLTGDDITVASDGRVKVTGIGWMETALRASGQTAFGPTESRLSADIASLGNLMQSMLTDTSSLSGQYWIATENSANSEHLPLSIRGIIDKCSGSDGWTTYSEYVDLQTDLTKVRECIKLGRSLDWSPEPEARARQESRTSVQLGTPKTVLAAQENSPPSPATQRGTQFAMGNGEVEKPVIVPVDGATRKKKKSSPVDERDPSTVLWLTIKILAVLFVLIAAVSYFIIAPIFSVPNDISVPNLVGKTYDEAVRISQQQNFKIDEGESDYNSNWPENQIYKQDPRFGSSIKPGRSVTVWRSKGPRTVSMPDLVSATADRALKELQDATINDVTSTEEFSDTVAKGIVISQQPPANAQVMRSASVEFVVSKGKQPPDVPTGLDAQPVGPNQVVLKWNASSRASNYSVTRTNDGNTNIVADGLKVTQFTDSNLLANTSYSYTVTASNASGPSGPSDTALVITPAALTTPPVLGDHVRVAPVSGGSDMSNATAPSTPALGGTDSAPAEMRQFVIRFRVPRHPRGSHRVKFQVQDATGSTLAYDEQHQAGDRIAEPITAFGNKITFRIFLDSKLVKQQTK